MGQGLEPARLSACIFNPAEVIETGRSGGGDERGNMPTVRVKEIAEHQKYRISGGRESAGFVVERLIPRGKRRDFTLYAEGVSSVKERLIRL